MARLSTLIVLLAGALPALAATYKWTDEKGEVHYGDNIPPQYINRGITEIDKRGQTIRKIEPALTPEQQKARSAEIARKKEDDKRAEEQRRKDMALIGTYSSEEEIDLARDRNTQQIDTSIRAAQERLASTRAHIEALQQQLEFFKGKDKATGKPRVAPAHLTTDLTQSQGKLAIFDAVIAELRRQREEVVQRFSEDRRRFREIKVAGVGSVATPAGIEVQKQERASTAFPINASTQALINDCIGRWLEGSRSRGGYAIAADLIREFERLDLVLDTRVGDARGQYTAQRMVCTLAPDGKIDPQGTEIKKALASLGAKY